MYLQMENLKRLQVQAGILGNERLTEILPAEEAGKRNLKASGYEEIDLQGKYILLPMHVHLAGKKPQKKQRQWKLDKFHEQWSEWNGNGLFCQRRARIVSV